MSVFEQQFRDSFRAKWSLLAALGAGCLVGVSGMVLMQRLTLRIEASQPQNVSKELASLHTTLSELQEEVRRMRTKPFRSALRNPTVSFSAIDDSDQDDFKTTACSFVNTPTNTDYFSALSSDEEEEFLDLPNDNDQDVSRGHAGRLSLEIQKFHDEECEHLHFFTQVDALLEGHAQDQKRALKLLRDSVELYRANAEFLWRLCKAVYLVALVVGQEGAVSQKQGMIFEAVELGQQAIDCDDNSSESHKWYGIAVGSRGEYLGIKKKILDGFEFKKHIDRASELAPNDHTIRHLLGRFCYEVAELSWLERKLAATLFADPPAATMEESLAHFMAAEELKPDGWKENRKFLAKTCIHLKDYTTALEWLDKANEMPIQNHDDQQAQDEVAELIKIYASYR